MRRDGCNSTLAINMIVIARRTHHVGAQGVLLSQLFMVISRSHPALTPGGLAGKSIWTHDRHSFLPAWLASN